MRYFFGRRRRDENATKRRLAVNVTDKSYRLSDASGYSSPSLAGSQTTFNNLEIVGYSVLSNGARDEEKFSDPNFTFRTRASLTVFVKFFLGFANRKMEIWSFQFQQSFLLLILEVRTRGKISHKVNGKIPFQYIQLCGKIFENSIKKIFISGVRSLVKFFCEQFISFLK